MGEHDPEIARPARGGVRGVDPQVVAGSERHREGGREWHASELRRDTARGIHGSPGVKKGCPEGEKGDEGGELAHFMSRRRESDCPDQLK
ncbi:hypothetical protein GCM10017559_29470 [Streptosporangium longisporum]|uniref:Uncharacterized protein n=1 Tax=Streptosporangium longisporum TaxID=46187 RepID=A0ABP6KH74_9ACTN